MRRYAKSETAAYRLAWKITRELDEHGSLAASLSTTQRYQATEAFRLLSQTGAQLLDVVREYMKRHPLGGNARTIDDVRRELIARKAKLGRSERHVKGLDYKLRTLIAAIGNKTITEVTLRDLEEELEQHPDWKPTTVHSTTQGWKILFNHAVKRGYIFENPADRLELPKVVHGEPHIFRWKIVAQLMAATLFRDRDPLLPQCRAYLAIGFFAGLRPYEIEPLRWEHVSLDSMTIRVMAADAKDRERRIVDIQPNLAAWLRPLARRSGAVLTEPLDKLRVASRNVLGLKEWPSDVMRHTFVSNHFAQFRNEAETKHQVGHRDDGRVFYNHYMVPISRPEARWFWSIVPPVAPLPCYSLGWAERHPAVSYALAA